MFKAVPKAVKGRTPLMIPANESLHDGVLDPKLAFIY
jgi:hypothetical protein